MRTQSSSRGVLVGAAISVGALLVLGGAFFVGYVSELQRNLNDPAAPRAQVAAHAASLEAHLGYNGFLKAYRTYRLTGDATLRLEMAKRAAAAKQDLEALRAFYAADSRADLALREAQAVADTFAHVAATAPATGPIALRGTSAMDALATLPQSHQLEAAYVSLSNTLARVLEAERDGSRGAVAAALNWSQVLFIVALGSLVGGIIVVTGLLHFGIIARTKSALDDEAAQVSEERPLLTAVTDLNRIAARLAQSAPLPGQVPPRDLADLTRKLEAEIQGLRGDIGDMTIRMAEERILANGGAPVFEAKAQKSEIASSHATRTLADVPGAEVLARLKDLAAEMTAAGDHDGKAALKAALEDLAREIEALAKDETPAQLSAVVQTFDDHADAIETHVGALEHAGAGVQAELRAITSGLRALAGEAHRGSRGDSERLRERAVALGARAQSLFTRLDGAPPRHDHAEPAPDMSIKAAAADIAALARSIVELEARADSLSRAAVSRLSNVSESFSPSESADAGRASETTADAAIRTVFESIDRLNNIAAALARAGDAERQHRVAH